MAAAAAVVPVRRTFVNDSPKNWRYDDDVGSVAAAADYWHIDGQCYCSAVVAVLVAALKVAAEPCIAEQLLLSISVAVAVRRSVVAGAAADDGGFAAAVVVVNSMNATEIAPLLRPYW